MDYSEGFYLSIAGIAVGVVTLAIRACMKSRCTRFELGCLRIERNAELEEREAEASMQVHRQKSSEEISL